MSIEKDIKLKLDSLQNDIDAMNIGDFQIIHYDHSEKLIVEGSFDLDNCFPLC